MLIEEIVRDTSFAASPGSMHRLAPQAQLVDPELVRTPRTSRPGSGTPRTSRPGTGGSAGRVQRGAMGSTSMRFSTASVPLEALLQGGSSRVCRSAGSSSSGSTAVEYDVELEVEGEGGAPERSSMVDNWVSGALTRERLMAPSVHSVQEVALLEEEGEEEQRSSLA